MSAPPLAAAITEQDVQDAIARLARVEPGLHWVVSCYLKLEPRDRTRGKYLIKMKTRAKGLLLAHEGEPEVAAILRQVLDYLEAPNHLPHARAISYLYTDTHTSSLSTSGGASKSTATGFATSRHSRNPPTQHNK